MVHCGERWVEMWKKHPEFCNKSRAYTQQIEYWIGLCDQIIARGFDAGLVYEKFPEGAARVIKNEHNAEFKTKALNYVCECLKSGEKVTAPDLKKTIKGWAEPEDLTPCSGVKCVANATKSTPDNEVKTELPPSPYQPAKGSIPVTSDPPQPSLAAQMKEPVQPAKPLPGSWISNPPRNLEEVKKAERERLEETAESLLEQMPRSTQLIVTDLLREHPSWKVKDCFYYGIEALAQKVVRR